MRIRMISLGAIALASLIAACAIDIPKPKAFIRIGTGPQVGVYYATGLALAELVNDGTVRHGVDATAESTEGSVFNINALLKNDLDIAFAQADHEYHAFHGEGDWEGAPHDELRFICGLYTEALALVAEASSGILGLEDVRGKNVSIGAAGSGTRSTALACLDLYDIEPDRDFRTAAFGPGEAGLMLQDGRIDAFFYATGHPNGFLTEATNGTHPVRFIPVTGMRQLLAQAPYYTLVDIPMQYYPNATNSQDVKSIGMRTALLTTVSADEETVYAVTKALFEHLSWFQRRHPCLRNLSFREMAESSFIPFHPGALRYFREQGMLDESVEDVGLSGSAARTRTHPS